jgi:hypothetical protein
MEARGPLKETAAWKRLEAFFAEQGSSLSIPAMFQADPDRFSKFSRRLETPKDGPFLVDFSKVRSRSTENKFITKECFCGSAFVSVRLRIQHFRSMRIQIRIRILFKKFCILSKIANFYPQASMN